MHFCGLPELTIKPEPSASLLHCYYRGGWSLSLKDSKNDSENQQTIDSHREEEPVVAKAHPSNVTFRKLSTSLGPPDLQSLMGPSHLFLLDKHIVEGNICSVSLVRIIVTCHNRKQKYAGASRPLDSN